MKEKIQVNTTETKKPLGFLVLSNHICSFPFHSVLLLSELTELLLHLPEVLLLQAYLEHTMQYPSCLFYTLSSCCLKQNTNLISE